MDRICVVLLVAIVAIPGCTSIAPEHHETRATEVATEACPIGVFDPAIHAGVAGDVLTAERQAFPSSSLEHNNDSDHEQARAMLRTAEAQISEGNASLGLESLREAFAMTYATSEGFRYMSQTAVREHANSTSEEIAALLTRLAQQRDGDKTDTDQLALAEMLAIESKYYLLHNVAFEMGRNLDIPNNREIVGVELGRIERRLLDAETLMNTTGRKNESALFVYTPPDSLPESASPPLSSPPELSWFKFLGFELYPWVAREAGNLSFPEAQFEAALEGRLYASGVLSAAGSAQANSSQLMSPTSVRTAGDAWDASILAQYAEECGEIRTPLEARVVSSLVVSVEQNEEARSAAYHVVLSP
ncbi:MAG: hypothetical protein QOE90_823 [Thermoplasmata archaeon]|jgi:hypothetical protein|nr:hypothetical protein [Thermoplasmata archaeon]